MSVKLRAWAIKRLLRGDAAVMGCSVTLSEGKVEFRVRNPNAVMILEDCSFHGTKPPEPLPGEVALVLVEP